MQRAVSRTEAGFLEIIFSLSHLAGGLMFGLQNLELHMSWKYKDVCELLSCMWFCWSVEYSGILIWWLHLLFLCFLWRPAPSLPHSFTIVTYIFEEQF